MTDHSDFEDQFRQEELAKKAAEKAAASTHPEGDPYCAEYEWIEEKQAWFPKIDADFIARYQLSYGQSSEEQTEPEKAEYTDEEIAKYWKEYYDYYNTYYNSPSLSTDGSSQMTPEQEEEYKRYLNDYYTYYYNNSDEPCAESTSTTKSSNKDEKTSTVKRKAPDPPKWFDVDESKNTNVYVSGLPLTFTDEEFNDLMAKCGLIMYDPRSKKPKLKLYRDENGEPKGDGRCCYIKRESVDLALQIIDGSDINGHKVKVEVAQFQMKGDFDPKKCKKKLTNKEKKKLKEKQEKLFDWHPDKLIGMRPNHEKVIVLKNMFDPNDFEDNPVLINDLRNDIRQECTPHGDVKKVVVFDRHQDGVVMVFYKEATAADKCKEALNHRWFAKRRILATTWDGQTKYDVIETEEEKQKRLKQWDAFLSGDANNINTDISTMSQEQDKNTPIKPVGSTDHVSESEISVDIKTEMPSSTAHEPQAECTSVDANRI